MIDEPVHTTSKERMTPLLMFSSKHMYQLYINYLNHTFHFQLCSACYTTLQIKRSAYAINPVTMGNNYGHFHCKHREAMTC